VTKQDYQINLHILKNPQSLCRVKGDSMKTLNILLFIILFSIVAINTQAQPVNYLQGLAGISYDDSKFSRPFTESIIKQLNSDSLTWRGSNDWSLRILGYLEAPFSGEVTIFAESDNYIRMDINSKHRLEAEKNQEKRSIKVAMEKGKKYPLEIWYSHDGGESFLRFFWHWPGQEKTLIPAEAIMHTVENKELVHELFQKAKAAIVKTYLTIPNPSPDTLPTLQAWQKGKETMVGITFPNIPNFSCDAWCYENEVDLLDIISLDQGRMKLIHTIRKNPNCYLVTLITPEPAAVSFTAWIEKKKNYEGSLPEDLLLPNICWQLKHAPAFASEPDPYPEFIKRCFIFTENGQTFLDQTDRKKIPVRKADEMVNNPPWVQVYVRNDQQLPEPDPNLWAGSSDTKYTNSIIGVVSRDKKYLAAIANNASIAMCQAWHDCVHNNPLWLPKDEPLDQRMWRLKIYAMENDVNALIKRVKQDFPQKDTLSPNDIKQIKTQGTFGTTYQTQGVVQNLPVSSYATRERLLYPMSWLSANYTDFDQWREKAKEVFRSTWQTLPAEMSFDPVVVDEQDRGSYVARKIALNITADNRILAYMLKPKGDGPFPAVLLLHDHGATFNIGKEKVIAPWGITPERIRAAENYTGQIYGNRFIGDELAKRGYVCFTIDALNWGDRGGGGMEGQQAIAANMLFMGMSFAGLIAHEDVRSAEFLTTLPFVDNSRIAAMGLSMGAYRTWQVAAVSDIVKAGVAVCWMATNQGLLSWFMNRSGGNSAYSMLHPGLFNYFDYPDVAAMACPKPMLFYNGINDKLFPVKAVEAAYQKMQTIWASQSAADKLNLTVKCRKKHLSGLISKCKICQPTNATNNDVYIICTAGVFEYYTGSISSCLVTAKNDHSGSGNNH
jgi:dienelactone hydrolase